MKILLVIYDNNSYIHWFPQSIGYITSALKTDKDNEITIYNQDLNHYPDEHLLFYLNENKFDVIGIGVVGGYYQYRKLLSLSNMINLSKNRPFYIIGGYGPSADPEFFLKKTNANSLVIGEGENTIKELIKAIKEGTSLDGINGIAYRDNDGIIKINPQRELIKDIDKIPFPAYELFPIKYYRLMRARQTLNSDFAMPVLSGRGCPFKCNFCYRMDKGFRIRSNESIIEEIKNLQKNYKITYISFEDDLLMSSEKRIMLLCEDFIKEGLKIKWECCGRLNYAKKEVLDIMKQAGCCFITYGVESFDDEALKTMNKNLTTEQIIKGTEATLTAGISPGLNIIFGNIGETKEILKKDVEFLLKYSDGAQLRTIRPVTPYPGSPLYYHAIQNGLLKDCEDFYENKHINSDLLTVNFTNMSDDEFHLELKNANEILINDYHEKIKIKNKEILEDLYINKNCNFRGFRQT